MSCPALTQLCKEKVIVLSVKIPWRCDDIRSKNKQKMSIDKTITNIPYQLKIIPKASKILSLDLCPYFMEVVPVVRQGSFPFLISLICLTFLSYGHSQFAFHTSCVLEVDLRQATILTSWFKCLAPRLWGRSNFLFHSQGCSILSRIRLSAEHLDLSPDNHY